MIEIKAPQKYTLDKTSLFLTGSIEMGKAIDWQAETVERLRNKDIIILNPRRLQWDASWKQRLENDMLGLCARKKNVFVHCPEDYWRELNVELVCQRYHLPFFKDFETLLEALSKKIT